MHLQGSAGDLIKTAGTAVANYYTGGAAGAVIDGAGGGADRTGVLPDSAYSPAPPLTTVSPAFQQAFTPQVSPVINAQIQSAGATATGAPVQQASGGQTARGGGSRATPGGAPPTANPAPPVDGNFPSPFANPFNSPVVTRQTNYVPLMTTAIIAAALLGGVFLFTNKGKGKRKK